MAQVSRIPQERAKGEIMAENEKIRAEQAINLARRNDKASWDRLSKWLAGLDKWEDRSSKVRLVVK